MKVIKNPVNLTIKLAKDDVLMYEGKTWIAFNVLAKKLGKIERDDRKAKKSKETKQCYKIMLHNSFKGGKFNSSYFAGQNWIDVENPQKYLSAINFTFKVGK